ncbi:MAG: hypothetical protein ACRDJW_19925 [Thermomicrobiales bacterium]
MSVVAGPHGGLCLAVEPVAGERTAIVLATLHRLMRQRGEQPAVLQTDRGPCFVGAEGGERRALPGRLTLWLWGLGITHRVLPPGKPWRNGAVERFQGAVEHSWTGEPDGLAAPRAVWNHGKAGAGTTLPYQGRAGFDLARVWAGLARGRVTRSVDAQGKRSVWDRPLRVGRRWALRPVVVTFDAPRRVAVVRDKQDTALVERALPWLTAAWLWAEAEGAEQVLDHDGTPTFR